MPHLRIRGVKKENLVAISKSLIDEMEHLMNCPRQFFTLELIETLYIEDGKENAEKSPHVEVHWFDRGQEVKTEIAKAITQRIKTVETVDDVCVFFIDMIKEDYYVNGKHY